VNLSLCGLESAQWLLGKILGVVSKDSAPRRVPEYVSTYSKCNNYNGSYVSSDFGDFLSC
jgi:hypothetical protein